MSIIFWSIKNSSEVIEKLRLRNFQGSQVSLFQLFYFIHIIATSSYQSKSVVSGQLGQNITSVLHLRQDFLPTRNMTRIDVGLARSYVKFLLSSWKTYMCNLMAWYINT